MSETDSCTESYLEFKLYHSLQQTTLQKELVIATPTRHSRQPNQGNYRSINTAIKYRDGLTQAPNKRDALFRCQLPNNQIVKNQYANPELCSKTGGRCEQPGDVGQNRHRSSGYPQTVLLTEEGERYR